MVIRKGKTFFITLKPGQKVVVSCQKKKHKRH
jgi:hypothetical protein